MRGNKHAIGVLALLVCTLIWGTSFVVLKDALGSVPTLWILAIRFTGAALLMALFAGKKLKTLDRGYLRGGAVMGLCLALAYILQTFGLVYTTPGKNAFLTDTYCVLVPFLWWFFKKVKPDRYNLTAAALCIVGIGLVSLTEKLSIGVGDGVTLSCGLFYALHIIATSYFIEGRDPVLLSLVQFAAGAVLCWGLAPLAEPFPASVPAAAWWEIAYLCLMCTGVSFLLQTLWQKYTPPSEVSILLMLESVFGVILSVIFYHEHLTLRVLSGFALIFIAILISETKLEFLHHKKTDF